MAGRHKRGRWHPTAGTLRERGVKNRAAKPRSGTAAPVSHLQWENIFVSTTVKRFKRFVLIFTLGNAETGKLKVHRKHCSTWL